MRTTLRIFTLSALALLGACDSAAPTDDGAFSDDQAAEAQAPTTPGKADGATLTGVWESHASSFRAGDVPTLALYADGGYVRSRCYHSSCGLLLPETDRFDTFTSGGKTYLRFWSFKVDWQTPPADPNPPTLPPGVPPKPRSTEPEKVQTPVVADTYEVRKTASGIKLRKTYTSRWLTLAAVSDAALCDETGGTVPGDGNPCDCGPSDGDLAIGFLEGAGGCWYLPSGSEDACDSSEGFYTDDDATRIATFCECGIGRYVATDGSCTDI